MYERMDEMNESKRLFDKGEDTARKEGEHSARRKTGKNKTHYVFTFQMYQKYKTIDINIFMY